MVALQSYAHGNRPSTGIPDNISEVKFQPGSLWDRSENTAPMQLDSVLWRESRTLPQPGSQPGSQLGSQPGSQPESTAVMIKLKPQEQKGPSTIDNFPYYPWDARVIDAKSKSRKQQPSTTSTASHGDYDQIYDYLNYNPISILTLGGSVAWGGSISNRYDAFPFLLGDLHPESRVDNLAIRATGASYPAACIQSLLEGDGAFPEYHVAPGVSSSDGPNAISYDIILLEFSVNGVESTDLLISRLKRRYPDAILVYVHLESITHPSGSNLNSDFFTKLMAPGNGVFYIFPKEEAYTRAMKKKEEKVELDGVGQHVNNIPKYSDLFADDRHHLSEIGHKMIANKVMDLLHRTLSKHHERIRPRRPRLGTWGGGDQCYMWLSSWGYFPESIEITGGGEFTIFDESKQKYSYEISYGMNATFNLDRRSFGGKSIPVHLVYMTLGNPPLYPKALVEINNDGEGDQANSHMLDPQTDPAFPEWSWAHLTRGEIIGDSKPGVNRITIQPIEESQNPFRLVGIVICGACEEEENYVVASNIRVRVPETI